MKILFKSFCAILCTIIIFVCACAGQKQTAGVKDLTYFLDRLAGEDCWLEPSEDEHAFMASSNQPVFKRDCNAFQRIEEENGKKWRVLVDKKGPGVITRFWTAGDFDGELQFIIDSNPVIVTTLRAFYGGGLEPFTSPLVLDHPQSSGGRISYFPIPFAKHIIIRSDSESDSFYWQVNYSLFSDSEIKSFDLPISEEEKAALELVSRRFREGTSFESKNTSLERFVLEIPAGKSAAKKITGGGIIRSINLTMTEDGWKYAGDLKVEMRYDGVDKPAVEAGLLDLAHLGSKIRQYSAVYSSFDGNTLMFMMPAPFDNGMEIIFFNDSKNSSVNCSIEIAVDTRSRSKMRFHARTHHEYPEFGKLITIEDIKGSGVFAGFNLITQAPASIGDTYFNQEGNEYITIDNGKNTIWRGTGTEDYFNCGYYYREGEVACPLHGCLDIRHLEGGRVSSYRIQKLDAVPFKNDILISLEPGCPKKGVDKIGEFVMDYRWTSFWYSPVVK